MKNWIIAVLLALFTVPEVEAQDAFVSYRLNLVQNPVTKLYGYAFREQNVRSPIRGVSASAVNLLGSGGSFMIGKREVEWIDWAVPAQYEKAAGKFHENVTMVKVPGGKVGFIDMYNRFVIMPIYDEDTDIDGFHHGLAAVKKDGKYGYIDKSGRIVIPFAFDKADGFDESLIAAVKKDGKWGAIDIRGDLVVPAEFKSKEAMKAVPANNKQWREAKRALEEQRDNGSLDDCLSALRQAASDLNKRIADGRHEALSYEQFGESGSFGMKDQYGRIIVPDEFSEIQTDDVSGGIIVKRADKYGLYTYNGGRVVGPCFETMTSSGNGRFPVSVHGVNGWINIRGELSDNLLSDLCNAGIDRKKTSKNEALDIYNTVLDINPEYASAYNNIALIDIDNEDYSKGMRELKLAADLDPENETIQNNLAWAKDARKERRIERLNTILQVSTAVVAVGVTAYSTYSAISGNSTAASIDGGNASYSGGGSGGGSSGHSSSGSSKCKYCNGSGTCSPSSYVSRQKACHGSGMCGYCDGTGWVGSGHARCTACHGTKVHPEYGVIGDGKCGTCGGSGKCHYCHGSGK